MEVVLSEKRAIANARGIQLGKEQIEKLNKDEVYCLLMACYLHDAGMGIKITYLRSVSSGTAGDRDVYGAQQHAPLLNLEVPVSPLS